MTDIVKGVIFLQNPPSYFDVVDSEELKAAMEELRIIEKKGTLLLVERPGTKNVIVIKWVFRVKIDSDAQNKYKAKLVVKGFSQFAITCLV